VSASAPLPGARVTSERSREVDVWNEVPLVPQLTGMSCWAAAAAMLVGWRERIAVDAREVARGAGHWRAFKDGLMPEDVGELARAWQLTISDAELFDAERLYELLSEFGPLWLGEASPGLHAIVVTGLYGDGSADGSFVRVNDPWPVARGERYVLSFRELARNFRAATSAVGAHAQVMHAGGRGGTRRSWSLREQVKTTITSPGVKEDPMSMSYGRARVSALSALQSGERYIQSSTLGADPLASHGGQGDNLYLAWNTLDSDLTAIDVVVHLHGYSSNAPTRKALERFVALSGADPNARSRPTLVLVPRGRKISQKEIAEYEAKSRKYNPKRYTFPGLTASDGLGLEQLLAHSLAWLCTEVLGRASGSLSVDRLIFTAHSGGGKALNELLKQHARRAACNPHEVQVFDAIYGDPGDQGDGVVSWAQAQVAADATAGASALRILWTDGTQSGTRWIAQQLSALPTSVARHYRFEYAGQSTSVHNAIPGKHGPSLLADAGVDLSLPTPQTLSAAYGTPVGLFRHYQPDSRRKAAPQRPNPALHALNGGRAQGLAAQGTPRKRSEREIEELGGESSESIAQALASGGARWADDDVSPDFRHIASFGASSQPFELTGASLARLAAQNRFTLPTSGKVPFGLRGCGVVQPNDGQFHARVTLEELVPDHVESRCVLGVWDRDSDQVAVFRGSTVPNKGAMQNYVDGKKPANLLLTGAHHYKVGPHKEFNGALRESGRRVVLRSRTDLVYTTSDRFEIASPFDNLHPSFRPENDEFSSAGCITVRGGVSARDDAGRPDYHQDPDDGTPGWASFRERLGLTRESAPASENDTPFTFVLLTGREARIVYEDTDADLARLRFGSSGAEVEALQRALAQQPSEETGRYTGTVDGRMGAGTTMAWIRYQQSLGGGAADGIVTPDVALGLGFELNSAASSSSLGLGRALARVVPGRAWPRARARVEALVDKDSPQAEQSEAVRRNIARSVAAAETNTQFDLLHYDSSRVNFGIGSWTGSRIADLLDTYERVANEQTAIGTLHAHFANQATFDALRARFRSQGAGTALNSTEEGYFRALGRDASLQDAQVQHLANDVRRDVDAIGSSVDNPWYPFIDSYMNAISELAGHVLVHASHQGSVQTMIREAVAHFGGEAALGPKMVDGSVTEPQFLTQVGEEVVARVAAKYRTGVRNRYARLLRDWSSSELAYYFNPA
jgi:peptidoglycan hydrolase-like protein with peptidoglycan-binding domain